MSAEPAAPGPDDAPGRMTGDQRREQILRAARRVFAEHGYAATTDQIARAAGVSQPYVVRLFGSKRELFAAAHRAATQEVLEVLAGPGAPPVVGPGSPHGAGQAAGDAMGAAYAAAILDDRDLLRLVMHGFLADDDEVARRARATLGEAFRLFRDRTGADEDEARTFVAQGMLLNVLLAVRAPEHAGESADTDALVECVRRALPTTGARA